MCYKHREYSITEAQEGTEGVSSNPTTLATMGHTWHLIANDLVREHEEGILLK